MTLKNLTNNTTVTNDLKEATTLIDKSLGLLKKSNPRSLMFQTHFGIHTFLLKKPIDVVILDNKYKVVKTATVKPNRIFIYNPTYSIVVELVAGTIKRSKMQIGDKLGLN